MEQAAAKVGAEGADHPLRKAVVAMSPALAWTSVGLPFDVVRARLATTSRASFRGPAEVLRATLLREGAAALWKGFWPAFVKDLPFATILFGMYRHFKPDPRRCHEPGRAKWRYYAGVFAAGASSGVPLTLWSNPLDVWRIRVQAAGLAGVSAAATDASVLTTLWARKRLLMRGASMTMICLVPGSGVYFVLNEVLTREVPSFPGQHWRGQLPAANGAEDRPEAAALAAPGSMHKFVAGGLSGFLFSLLLVPAEVVKARLIVSDTLGVLETVRLLYREMGMRGFYRGASVICAKAAVIHGAGWWMMHYAEQAMGIGS